MDAGPRIVGAAMAKTTKEDIASRAERLWEQAGKPRGRFLEYYYLAEQELRNADRSNALRTPETL